MNRESNSAQLRSTLALAGVLLLLAGIGILMGIITAEALYPAPYTTAENEISDLGATRPPDSIILQPSATIFNFTMVITGLLVIAASLFLHRGLRVRSVTAATMLLGIGIFGVGVFPGNIGSVHPWFALLAFVAGGLAAILSARVVTGLYRFIAVASGVTTLVFLFGSGIFISLLGDGGTERWIAYPVVLWLVGFGGYLLGGTARSAK